MRRPAMSVMRGCAAGLCAALLCTAIPATSAHAEEGTPSISAIRFRGNDGVSAGAIRRVMKLRQPVWWNPFRKTPYLGSDYLALDLYRVLDLYRDRGYPLAVIDGAQVTISPNGEKVEIAVTIEEGSRLRVSRVALHGVQEPLREQVRKLIPVRPGDILSRRKIEDGRLAVSGFYGEARYLRARMRAELRLVRH